MTQSIIHISIVHDFVFDFVEMSKCHMLNTHCRNYSDVDHVREIYGPECCFRFEIMTHKLSSPARLYVCNNVAKHKIAAQTHTYGIVRAIKLSVQKQDKTLIKQFVNGYIALHAFCKKQTVTRYRSPEHSQITEYKRQKFKRTDELLCGSHNIPNGKVALLRLRRKICYSLIRHFPST